MIKKLDIKAFSVYNKINKCDISNRMLFYAFSIRQSLVSVRAVISTLREIGKKSVIEKENK